VTNYPNLGLFEFSYDTRRDSISAEILNPASRTRSEGLTSFNVPDLEEAFRPARERRWAKCSNKPTGARSIFNLTRGTNGALSLAAFYDAIKTWMAGTSPAMTTCR
jgi:hypothetical protein